MGSCCGWLTDHSSCSSGQAQADRLEELGTAVLAFPPCGRAALIRFQPDTERVRLSQRGTSARYIKLIMGIQ
eukprot:789452-Heterocapsa_arctica.AAC.1